MSSNVKFNGNEEEMVHEISDDSDDSDVEMHEDEETTENAVVEMTDEQKSKIAEFKKAQGNEHYKKKSYAAALNLYTEAIDLCPTCSAYYGNRSATFIMMSQYGKALDDARRSVLLDPTFVRGHLREAKCYLAMGEPPAACRSYEIALQLEPENNMAKHELQQARHVRDYQIQAEKSYSEGDYRRVLYCMDKSIELSPACRKFRIAKAECLALLKRYQESQDIVNDVLRFEGMNAEALYVRGLCLYYLDHIDKAFQHFQQVLRLAPDLQKAKNVYRQAKSLLQKKEEGNQAFRAHKFQDAYGKYTEALAIDPNNVFVNAKLYCNRALVLVKLNKSEDAIMDCTKALELDNTYTKALLRRAKCYTDREQYEEAVRDYETLHKLDKTRENKALLQEAKLTLKKSKRKDYYKILGISKSATDDEIKKAYKKSALKYHPDRHASASDETKKEQEKKFKEVGEAYTVLSDAKKKARYDSGQDLEEMDGAGFSDIDPNQIFQAFFGGSGGGYSFQQSGFSGGGAQYPGNFSSQFG